ncbi:hypothetical protein [Streptomyces sp. 7N604]|uniref:hypothetical protein n=1 Tax=Streptomyces sp. 7N604 TaxID=3457415 RepID=UPI003FD4D971
MSWTLSIARAARRADGWSAGGARVCAARASVFTVVSVVLAVTGHHLVSGGPVPWQDAMLAAGLLFALSTPLARALRSLPAVALATAGTQAGLHFWLARLSESALSAHAAGHPPAGHAGHVGHGLVHQAPLHAHEAWHAGHHGPAMVAAHTAAALIVGWCLHRTDAACRSAPRLARAARQSIGTALMAVWHRLTPVRPTVCRRLLRPTRARARPPRRTAVALTYAVVRRGPPAAGFDLAA